MVLNFETETETFRYELKNTYLVCCNGTNVIMSYITFRIWPKLETVFLVSLLKKNKYGFEEYGLQWNCEKLVI